MAGSPRPKPGSRPAMPRGKLRVMAKDDLEQVTEIERVTFPDPWSKRSFAAMLRQDHIHAIVLPGPGKTIEGYAMASLVADEGEILNIAVREDARGKGSGRLMLDALLAYLGKGGATRIFLEVRRSNDAAIGLYKASGFVPLGVRPSYYAEPREDALTMVLEPGSQSAGK
jgi:ribosomal-protein-alanine N-acetyltransferase